MISLLVNTDGYDETSTSEPSSIFESQTATIQVNWSLVEQISIRCFHNAVSILFHSTSNKIMAYIKISVNIISNLPYLLEF